MKDSFIFHFENIEDMEDLTLEQKGMIFEAMIGYSISGNEPNFTDPELRGAWRPIRRRLKKDMEAYEERCSRNRSNGTKGGRPKENHTVILETQKNPEKPKETQKNRMVIFKNPEKPKKPDTDTDTDTVTVTDTESIKDTQCVKEKQSKKKPAKVATSAYVLDPKLNDAICEFIKHRNKLRKPMTDKAIELFIKRLQELSDSAEEQIRLINKSILKGWLTVYPDDDKQNQAETLDAHIMGIINGG